MRHGVLGTHREELVDEARPQTIAAAVFRLPDNAARIDVDHDLD